MDTYRIVGGRPIVGEITIQGAKNSVLPILAATLLVKGKSVIHNCPDLLDVSVAVEILRHLGCRVIRNGNTTEVDASGTISHEIPDELMAKMRSSVMFLGPVLARSKKAHMTFPGGCELGPRPIDLHLMAMKQMGASVSEGKNSIECIGEKLIGTDIHLAFPSVGATENIIMAATSASAKTRIINAACEPEIVDLQNFLVSAGFNVVGAGTSVIEIVGTDSRTEKVEHRIMPDRIAAQTYLIAAGITGGKITINGINPMDILVGVNILEKAGFKITMMENSVTLDAKDVKVMSVEPIKTMPHPAFPTDAQAIFMALMAIADGTTIFVENIFDNRYRHVHELSKMGMNAKIIDRVCVVSGTRKLKGSNVVATDLRGGAALVLAALSAEGQSYIKDIFHIDRGYDNLEGNLKKLGANILRI